MSELLHKENVKIYMVLLETIAKAKEKASKWYQNNNMQKLYESMLAKLT